MTGIENRIRNTVNCLNFWDDDNHYSYSKKNDKYSLIVNGATIVKDVEGIYLLKELKQKLKHYLFD